MDKCVRCGGLLRRVGDLMRIVDMDGVPLSRLIDIQTMRCPKCGSGYTKRWDEEHPAGKVYCTSEASGGR